MVWFVGGPGYCRYERKARGIWKISEQRKNVDMASRLELARAICGRKEQQWIKNKESLGSKEGAERERRRQRETKKIAKIAELSG